MNSNYATVRKRTVEIVCRCHTPPAALPHHNNFEERKIYSSQKVMNKSW